MMALAQRSFAIRRDQVNQETWTDDFAIGNPLIDEAFSGNRAPWLPYL